MKFNLKHTKHAVGQNAYHLVWKPKYSLDLFKSTHYRKVCEGALRQVAINYDYKIYEMQVMPDHVHLFVECPKTISVSKTLQLFKALREEMQK